MLLAVPLIALLPVGLILHLQLQTIEERGKFVADMQVPSLAIIGKVTRTFGEMRALGRDYVYAPGDKDRAEILTAFEADEKKLTQLLAQYSDNYISDERDRRLMNDYRQLTTQWIAESKGAIPLVAEGKRAQAIERIFSSMPALAARIGVEAGAVVVDAAGEIFGDVPNTAARVQAVAEPGAVLITARVQRQVAGLFVA